MNSIQRIPFASFCHYLVICAFSLLVNSCAQMLPLSGGEKDTTPPKVVNQVPENKTTTFTGNEIKIDFDEFIQVKDVQSQLIITPRLQKDPDIKVAGKSLSLKFNESLSANTTYNVNFGSAIADVHEGNVLSGLSVIFSTGSFIDSFYVSGKVKDAFTQKPVADVSVMLYLNGDDSSMFKRKPDYFSKTDNGGNYRIDNIHGGKYKVVAMSDKNKNFTYEQGEESIDMAYTTNDNLVSIDSSAIIDFEIFREEPGRFFLKRVVHPVYGRAIFVFNKPFVGSLRTPDLKEETNYFFNEGRDSLHINYLKGGKDTLRFLLIGPDDRIVEELVLAKQDGEKFEKDLKGGKFKPRIYGISQLNTSDRIYIYTSNVFRNDSNVIQNADIDLSRIVFVQGKDTLRFNYPAAVRKGVYSLKTEKPVSGKGEFIFYAGAFKGYENSLNDTLRLAYEWKTKEDLGLIYLSLRVKEKGRFVVELINDRGAVSEKQLIDAGASPEHKVTFSRLTPGNYSLRMFKDENEDGKWTPGNLLQGINPEKVFYNDKPIKLLADWEMNITWETEQNMN